MFYDTDDELAEALHKGEITAALTNANRITTDEWVLETFDETPFYMAVRKGDTQTLALLNGAWQRWTGRNHPGRSTCTRGTPTPAAAPRWP